MASGSLVLSLGEVEIYGQTSSALGVSWSSHRLANHRVETGCIGDQTLSRLLCRTRELVIRAE